MKSPAAQIASTKLQPARKRILIVDDHPLVRQGLADIIADQPELTVCGEAASAAEAMRIVKNGQVDLAVIDLFLQEGSGMELIKDLTYQYKNLLILVSSMQDDMLFVERAVRAGARGYVSKREPTREVLIAIREVLQGSCYFPEEMRSRLISKGLGSAIIPAQDSRPVDQLSDRELEVFALIGRGLTTIPDCGTTASEPKDGRQLPRQNPL